MKFKKLLNELMDTRLKFSDMLMEPFTFRPVKSDKDNVFKYEFVLPDPDEKEEEIDDEIGPLLLLYGLVAIVFDGKDYKHISNKFDSNDRIVEFHFYIDDWMGGIESNKTGLGNQYYVMSAVIQLIKRFMSKNANKIDYVSIKSKNDSTKRVYKTLAKKFEKEFNFSFFLEKEVVEEGKNIVYQIYKRV